MSNPPILFTAEAIDAALRLRASRSDWHELSVRVYIDGKGCDGFSYGVTFDEQAENDIQIDLGGIQAVVDSATLGFIHGSTVEWVDDERGRGFLVTNPKHNQFRGKFYRKVDWQSKIAPATSDSASQ